MEQRTTIQVTEKLRVRLKVLAARRDLSYQELLGDMASVFEELNSERMIINVPKNLYLKTQKQLEGSDMQSVSEYLTFLLRLVISDEGLRDKEDPKKLEETLKKRLQALGYLD